MMMLRKKSSDDETAHLVSKEIHCCGQQCPEPLRVNKKLALFKAQYFFFYGAIASALPFLAVFFKQLGMSPTQIGAIYGIKPFVGLLAAIAWGALADRYRLRKAILLLSIAVMAMAFLVIFHLPGPRRSEMCPLGLPPDLNDTSPEQAQLVHDYGLVTVWAFVEADVRRLFAVIMVLVVIGELFWSPVGALGDVALLAELGSADIATYSRQRSWGALAMALFQLGTGAALKMTLHLVEICGVILQFTNYKVCAYIFSSSLAIDFVISSLITFKYEKGPPSQLESLTELQEVEHSTISNVSGEKDWNQKESNIQPTLQPQTDTTRFQLSTYIRLMWSVHYGSWLCCMCYMGFCNGIILGFLFWYLEELGGSKLLMGVAGGMASGTEFVFFYVSHWLVRRTGPINMLYVSLITYALRFTNYTFMVNPWLVLPSEVLQGFTFAAGWAAFVQHAADALSGSYLAVMMGTVHGVYWGLGLGCGNLLGGVIIEAIGAKMTFQVLIWVTLGFTVLFFLAQTVGI